MANESRNLNLTAGNQAGFLQLGQSQSRSLAENVPTPNARFMQALQQMLIQQQQLSRLATGESQLKELDIRQAQLGAGREPLPETLRTADPRLKTNVLAARQEAFEPALAGERGFRQTFGAQLGSFGDVLQSTRQLLQDEENRQNQLKEEMRNQILLASQLGGAEGLNALLQANPNAFKVAGLEPNTLLAAARAQETTKKEKESLELQKLRAEIAKLQKEGTGDGKVLSPSEAALLGVPYGTTEGAAASLGITPVPTGQLGVEAQKLRENAQSGLRALETIESELLEGGTSILFKAAVPGSLFARTFETAKKEAADVITRLRTGAAINANEEKFYKSQLPNVKDLTDPGTIDYKIGLLRTLFTRMATLQRPTNQTQTNDPLGIR